MRNSSQRTAIIGVAFGLVLSVIRPEPVSAQAAAATAPPATAARPARTAPSGYLSPDIIDMLTVLPPAPQNDDARDSTDRRLFRETRKLEGSARWQMAADDAELGSAAMLKHFSCSLDIELTPQQAPKVVAMLQKATRDAAQAMARGKDYYKRQRPFQVQEGATCRPREEVANSFDYPSGHTTAGWAWALGLAQMVPERASPILARGRAIGDSRVVCGVHNFSAVEAARFLTGATMAVVTGTPAWRDDMDAARAELAALRAAPHGLPDPVACKAEAELVRVPW